MKKGKIIFILWMIGITLQIQGIPITAKGTEQNDIKLEEQRVIEWRKERDIFERRTKRGKKDKKRSALFPVPPCRDGVDVRLAGIIGRPDRFVPTIDHLHHQRIHEILMGVSLLVFKLDGTEGRHQVRRFE